MKDNKAERILKKIQEHIGGDFKISRRCVPHLIINNYYSVYYFGRKRFLRIFSGYATPDNKKLIDLKTREDVIFYFKKIN